MNEQNDQQLFAEAYNRTLGLISRREHSADELRRKLAARGYDEAIRERVLEQLQSRGLQSDRVFAEEFIASKKRRGFGPMKIAAQLQQHGIGRETVGELLAEHSDEWLQSCRVVMRRKYGQNPDPDNLVIDQRERQRRSRFLQQRGFSAAMVAKVLRDKSE